MKSAIVLLSGGIDSTTTLAIANAEGYETYAISFKYGQRHILELDFAKLAAASFNAVKHLIVDFDLRDIGGSALTSDIEVPKDRTKNLPTGQAGADIRSQTINKKGLGSGFCAPGSDIPITYVPARNTIFLSFALSYAEVIGAGDIFIGVNAVDYSGYPDCRPEFIAAFESMANLATRASVEGHISFALRTPLISMSKAEIIKKGADLGVDFSETWSCYDPQKRQNTEHRNQKSDKKNLGSGLWALGSEKYVPCMQCDSCLIRAKGFRDAGMDDPLILKVNN